LFDKSKVQRKFPWNETIDGREITFRLMSGADRKAVLAFTQDLPEQNVIFLRMDITKPAMVAQWIDNIKRGYTITVLALDGKKVVGYASLHHNEALWMRHLGEVRFLVTPDFQKDGVLEQRLANEIFHIGKEMGLYRIVAQIPTDQPRVQAILEHLGFQAEALLTEWLMTQDGQLHDMLIMSYRIQE